MLGRCPFHRCVLDKSQYISSSSQSLFTFEISVVRSTSSALSMRHFRSKYRLRYVCSFHQKATMALISSLVLVRASFFVRINVTRLYSSVTTAFSSAVKVMFASSTTRLHESLKISCHVPSVHSTNELAISSTTSPSVGTTQNCCIGAWLASQVIES